jgi:hypothetical protein
MNHAVKCDLLNSEFPVRAHSCFEYGNGAPEVPIYPMPGDKTRLPMSPCVIKTEIWSSSMGVGLESAAYLRKVSRVSKPGK